MKHLMFIGALFCVITSNAQNYLISFAGTGASSSVNTVKVENLTSGLSLTLSGNDILHLTSVTSIRLLNNTRSSELKIFPNPSTGISKLQFSPPVQGNAVITLYDITGKQVAYFQDYLETYLQEFQLSGLNNGLYLISFSGNNYHYSGKLLSDSNSDDNVVSIQRISHTQAVDEKQSDNIDKGSQSTIEMKYAPGERLKFTGTSGNFSTVKTDIPSGNRTITFNFMSCTDGDINNYPVVEIGDQTWMAINLKTTKYNNGDVIGTTTPATLDISAETTPKYQWAYAGEESNAVVYGRLYTWYAVTDSRTVCPTGWYIPNDGDWTILTNFLGGLDYAGRKLKEIGTIHWSSSNEMVTDEAGFTALPGGWHHWNGTFVSLDSTGVWHSSTEYNTNNGWIRAIYYHKDYVQRSYSGKKAGFSVRCLKVSVLKVITASVATFGTATATVGGEVITHGGSAVTDRGIYYGINQNPVTSGKKLQIGSGEGIFTSDIAGLSPNTTYYVTAYATNSIGTSYGDEKTFKTKPLTLPVLKTTAVTSITQSTATGGGDITYDGGTEVTARGVCWSKSQNPTISGSHTTDGTGSGVFISNLKELTINTKYYIRAYATNSIGTSYGEQRFFSTKGATGTVSDVDGNTYSTIQIGTQWWMAENLRTTKYRDNTPIPRVTGSTAWKDLTTPAYCWFSWDSLTNKIPYGALYNWYSVATKKICPTGWHVPEDSDWETFGIYIGGEEVAGAKMKEAGTTHWMSPNTGATDELGFTALPGGFRRYTDGSFSSIRYYGEYWSSTEYSADNAAGAELSYNSGAIKPSGTNKKYGFSVRCIKDN